MNRNLPGGGFFYSRARSDCAMEFGAAMARALYTLNLKTLASDGGLGPSRRRGRDALRVARWAAIVAQVCHAVASLRRTLRVQRARCARPLFRLRRLMNPALSAV